MDKLIKASLIASIVTIGGNMDKKENPKEFKEHINNLSSILEKKKEETSKASSLKKFLTCDNCFQGFGDKKIMETETEDK